MREKKDRVERTADLTNTLGVGAGRRSAHNTALTGGGEQEVFTGVAVQREINDKLVQ